MNNRTGRPKTTVERRDALKTLLSLGLWLPIAARGQADERAADAPPQENDVFVYALGEREGQVVAPGDLRDNEPQIFAYPMDASTATIRNGTRLNQVLLVRIDPEQASEPTRARAAASVVGYSAVCTHTGCDITDWDDETRRFQCPCHDSQFDPADGARVVGGPAPRPLPSLPLKLEGGVLAAAGGFTGPVGFQQPGLDPFGF